VANIKRGETIYLIPEMDAWMWSEIIEIPVAVA